MKQPCAHANTPLPAFSCFISDDIITAIVTSTNKKIEKEVEASIAIKNFYYKTFTDEIEIRAFIGLLYMRGLLGLSKLNYQYLFNSKIGPPIFGATMSGNRFSFLHANICFDDIATRRQRWPDDKFTAIREIFELFNDNCGAALNPTDYLSLDETLYATRNGVAFRQYNPSKPARYGIL